MLVILLILLETSMITTSLNMKKRKGQREQAIIKKGETSCWSNRLLSLPIVPFRFAFDQLAHSP